MNFQKTASLVPYFLWSSYLVMFQKLGVLEYILVNIIAFVSAYNSTWKLRSEDCGVIFFLDSILRANVVPGMENCAAVLIAIVAVWPRRMNSLEKFEDTYKHKPRCLSSFSWTLILIADRYFAGSFYYNISFFCFLFLLQIILVDRTTEVYYNIFL